MSGWVEGDPFLIRQTCKDRAREVDLLPPEVNDLPSAQPVPEGKEDHERVRWPQRLRFAASINFSTSARVRCSRVRSAELGRRSGTVRTSVVGECAKGIGFIGLRSPIWLRLSEY